MSDADLSPLAGILIGIGAFYRIEYCFGEEILVTKLTIITLCLALSFIR